MPQRVAITGFGYAVPPQIRTNYDPIFDWLRAHPVSNLFTGYQERRVLPAPDRQGTPPNTVADLMVSACRDALKEAELQSDEIDLLAGWASISEYLTPNALSLVHKELGLRDDAWLLPVEGLENFSTALMTADAMIKAERGRNSLVIKNALVVAGCNWTQYVDYHTPQSASAGDGAGAVVLARTNRKGLFELVDSRTEVMSTGYGGMFMQGDGVPAALPVAWSTPYFHITPAGVNAFNTFGKQAPVRVAQLLLKKHGLKGKDVTLIAHQASRVLMNHWQAQIQPGQYLDTMLEFANMVSATVPVTFAYKYNHIDKDYVLFLNPSAEFKAVGALLKRNS